jgi:N6-adenosine-specific RNA methylase IME4
MKMPPPPTVPREDLAGDLSADERTALAACEQVIEVGLQTFFEVGEALNAIRDRRLYREHHPSFEVYCQERWRMSASRGRQLIAAAKVVDNLQGVTTVTPANEWQARLLVSLPPDIQRRVWEQAVEDASDGEVSSNHIQATIEALKQVAPRLLIKGGQDARRSLEQHRREQRLEAVASEARTALALGAIGVCAPVLVADPPWRFLRKISDSRDVENHYPTMTLDDICALPVAEIATVDAILFLWTISSHLVEALEVIRRWGFTYKTHGIWVKSGPPGQGHYFRQQHEVLLLAVRGAMPTPSTAARVSSVIQAPRGRHSEKPETVYEIIEAMYPAVPKVELFARKRRPGWTAWGDQIGVLCDCGAEHSTSG